MSLLALRNLFRDRVRLIVTLTGIVFAIVLIAIQMGLLLGFMQTIAGVVDRSNADIWIAGRDVPFLEHAAQFPSRTVHHALATPGVVAADRYILRIVNWKRADGAQLPALMIGFDLASGLGKPWNVVAGELDSLKAADSIFIDRLYQEKLGITGVGGAVEINDRRARVVGFTEGIRSFTTSPYIFTSVENAAKYVRLPASETFYVLVKTQPGADIPRVKADLSRRLRNVDVYTTKAFADRTRSYWLLTTGAGFTVLLAAAMGLIVGIVVVSQTIYASTMDHLREYGTLKAMGASNRYLYSLIVKQAGISGAIGYALAMAFTYAIVFVTRGGHAAIVIPWQMAAAMCILTFVMCVSASFVSINKVTTIDPAMVFK